MSTNVYHSSGIQPLIRAIKKANRDGIQKQFLYKRSKGIDRMELINENIVQGVHYEAVSALLDLSGTGKFRSYCVYINLPEGIENV